HGLLHEFTHVDGQIFRTIRYLVFRPGFLSVEYFEGRRRAYINPVRLLLTAVLLVALLGRSSSVTLSIGILHVDMLPPGVPVLRDIGTTVRQLDVYGLLKRELDHVAATKDVTSEAAVEKFNHELKTYGTALSFSNVLLLAALLHLMFH